MQGHSDAKNEGRSSLSKYDIRRIRQRSVRYSKFRPLVRSFAQFCYSRNLHVSVGHSSLSIFYQRVRILLTFAGNEQAKRTPMCLIYCSKCWLRTCMKAIGRLSIPKQPTGTDCTGNNLDFMGLSIAAPWINLLWESIFCK